MVLLVMHIISVSCRLPWEGVVSVVFNNSVSVVQEIIIGTWRLVLVCIDNLLVTLRWIAVPGINLVDCNGLSAESAVGGSGL